MSGGEPDCSFIEMFSSCSSKVNSSTVYRHHTGHTPHEAGVFRNKVLVIPRQSNPTCLTRDMFTAYRPGEQAVLWLEV